MHEDSDMSPVDNSYTYPAVPPNHNVWASQPSMTRRPTTADTDAQRPWSSGAAPGHSSSPVTAQPQLPGHYPSSSTAHSYPPNNSPLAHTYPPTTSSSTSRVAPVQNRMPTASVQHPLARGATPTPGLAKSRHREQEDGAREGGGLRVKTHYVAGPERAQHDEEVSQLREQAKVDRENRMKMEASLAEMQKQMVSQRREMEQQKLRMESQRQEMEQVAKMNADWAQWGERVEREKKEREKREAEMEANDQAQEEEDEDMINVQAELLVEREGRAADKQRYEKTIATQANEIANLFVRHVAQSTDAPRNIFPSGPPRMIPQFVPHETRVERQLKVLRNKPRALPTLPLRPAHVEEAEDDGDGEGPNDEYFRDPGIVELITRIVEDVMRRAGLVGREKKGSDGKRARTKLDRARILQQNKMTKGEDKLWKAAIRAVWRKRYNIHVAAEFAAYTPAPSERVERCNEGLEGPADDEYTLDFASCWGSSLWNEDILTRMTESIQASHEQSAGSWGIPAVSDEYVYAILYGQLKQAQEVWAKCQPRHIQQTFAMETPQQVKQRLEIASVQRRLKTKSTSSKHRKFENRVKCIKMILELKEDGAFDYATWIYLLKLVERLGPRGMSSEEEAIVQTATKPITVYNVKVCAWRAPEIVEYMDYIDEARPHTKSTKGAPLTQRERVQDVGSANAPVNLPEKMYDATWLAEQKKTRPFYVSKTLKVSGEAFNFLMLATNKGKERAMSED